MLAATTQLLPTLELVAYCYQIRFQVLGQLGQLLRIAWAAPGVTRSIACKEQMLRADTQLLHVLEGVCFIEFGLVELPAPLQSWDRFAGEVPRPLRAGRPKVGLLTMS
jgi:hypothetical protein